MVKKCTKNKHNLGNCFIICKLSTNLAIVCVLKKYLESAKNARGVQHPLILTLACNDLQCGMLSKATINDLKYGLKSLIIS